ncbi:hypothetical protein ACFFRR_008562 [Megaselia abdita]
MPWNSKSTVQAKKVAPPAIPLDHLHHHHNHNHSNHRISTASSTGSTETANTSISSDIIADDGISLQLRDNSVAYKMKENSDYGFVKGVPSVIAPQNYNSSLGPPLSHKATMYYHQQLALQEDQGIDLAQSPGRDSPGSSSGSAGSGSGSRHSTASLDSGRASSYITSGGGPPSIRGGQFSSPRCSSVSSCSIGSVDRNDILDWLIEVKFEDYSQLFISAGYDLPTIARMTPEDLTAIGITNPQHRERIKKHIDKLQVVDNLPDFVPGSIEEWLRLLRLEEYIQPLLEQNYKTVRDVTQVTWEDLEDIGIVKLGHQKKILLAIKRVKDILSGKRNQIYSTVGLLPPIQQNQYTTSQYYQQQLEQLQLPPPPSSPPLQTTTTNSNNSTRVSWDDSRMPLLNNDVDVGDHKNNNNIVLIKVRQPRGKSLESLEDISDRNNTRSQHLTFSHYSTGLDYHYIPQQVSQQKGGVSLNPGYVYPQGTVTWRRSYDDGDITPTNESGLYAGTAQTAHDQGGGTLPRQRRNMTERAMSHDPNAMSAKMLDQINSVDYTCIPYNAQADMAGTYIPNNRRFHGLNQSALTKKIAPEPPRRNCSMRSSRGSGGFISSSDVVDAAGNSIPQAQNYMQMQVPGQYQQHHIQQQQQAQQNQPIYMNFSQIQQTTQAEVHCENPYENKRDSSIDSIDTIPFANENTGTIKQQKLYKQDIVSSLSLSSSTSSSSSSTTTVANVTQSLNSLKISSPSSLHGLMGGSAGASIAGSSENCDQILENSLTPEEGGAICSSSNNGANGGGNADSLNVLNDIGNMLANLTDELDAMLEEEKRVGITDSE